MLSARFLRKEFGSVVAVRNVSFNIEENTTFGLIGPNGAGKTTTMRMILGILTPEAGSIEWKGTPVDAEMRRRFGYLPEERGLYAKMTVREQIRYFGRLHGLGDGQAARSCAEWIDRLELDALADRPCAELSKGNQQKVQVACAAVHSPELLVLDEPFSGLDPINADMLFAVLGELRAAGATLVLSSHQMWQLEELCSAFCIISNGENRAAGTLAELRENFSRRIVRVAPASAAAREILESLSGTRALKDQDGVLQYEVPADAPFSQMLRRLVDVEALTRFEVVEPSLHDIYIHAVEGDGAPATS
jgi:ABC-2 type transport system ATP-binding protein